MFDGENSAPIQDMKSGERIYGIALLLLNSKGELFCVKELTAKPEIGKNIGDYSFPWETQEKGEEDKATLLRLLREEVHGNEEIKVSPPLLLGEFSVVQDTLARVYMATFLTGPEELRGLHTGKEIEPLGWQTKEFLLSRCRAGVRKALDLLEQYQKEKRLV